MPKIVDPELRRDAIADALFEVLRGGGLSTATLANVASRAGRGRGHMMTEGPEHARVKEVFHAKATARSSFLQL